MKFKNFKAKLLENIFAGDKELPTQNRLTQVTSFSKCLSFCLFISLPFIGSYIGYWYSEIIQVDRLSSVMLLDNSLTVINPLSSPDVLEEKIFNKAGNTILKNEASIHLLQKLKNLKDYNNYGCSDNISEFDAISTIDNIRICAFLQIEVKALSDDIFAYTFSAESRTKTQTVIGFIVSKSTQTIITSFEYPISSVNFMYVADSKYIQDNSKISILPDQKIVNVTVTDKRIYFTDLLTKVEKTLFTEINKDKSLLRHCGYVVCSDYYTFDTFTPDFIFPVYKNIRGYPTNGLGINFPESILEGLQKVTLPQEYSINSHSYSKKDYIDEFPAYTDLINQFFDAEL